MEWAWLAPALCFVAFGLWVLVGRFLPGSGAVLSIAAAGGSVAVFWRVLTDRLAQGEDGSRSVSWFQVGDSSLTWGMVLDPLAVVMLGIVSLVALAVQIYSLGYIRGDSRFGWYFAVHALFAGAMLTVVLADNLVLLYIAWELVGLCSYLLIGFWYERRPVAEAAKKAFITTRIGDVGFLIAILVLFNATGTFNLREIFQQVESLSSATVTVAALLLFLGAAGKSAQFPLHVWLPDAMEGPTPVSALIHAATMVAAGVYLVARTFPLFEAAPAALLVVATIGLVTALMAAGMALVMTDLKRILAYSTISHLGFMMLALGVGGVSAALFHLLAHAFSKALLFLGAGSVMHSTEKTDIREMGGLRQRMPLTAYTFALGALSLAGIPPLSGFFSKDEVLLSVLEGGNPLFLGLALVAALLSALYMARALFLVFFGPLAEENRQVHESPLVMVAPMVLLAAVATVAGFLALGWTEGYRGFASFLLGPEEGELHINPALMAISILVAGTGVALGWAFYLRRSLSPERVIQRMPRLHQVLVNKFYLDDAFQWAIDRVVLVFSRAVALFDRLVVNDVGVNGAAESVYRSGFRLRLHETGKMYNYALGMVMGAVLAALLWWMARL